LTSAYVFSVYKSVTISTSTLVVEPTVCLILCDDNDVELEVSIIFSAY